jgi:hypothetical protein
MDPTHDRVKSSGGTPSEASQPIRFAGSVLDAKRHVCAFFHNPDEKYRVLLPFSKTISIGARRRSTSSIPSCEPSTAYSSRRPASMWRQRKRVVSSSYATGLTPLCAMVTSIRIGCSL